MAPQLAVGSAPLAVHRAGSGASLAHKTVQEDCGVSAVRNKSSLFVDKRCSLLLQQHLGGEIVGKKQGFGLRCRQSSDSEVLIDKKARKGGTKQIVGGFQGKRSKKSHKKLQNESGEVHSGLDADFEGTRSRKVVLEDRQRGSESSDGAKSPLEGERSSRRVDLEDSPSTRSDVSKSPLESWWLLTAGALAAACIGGVVGSQGPELLRSLQDGTTSTVIPTRATGDATVEKVLARQLAQRFHDMSPAELAAVLEELIDARGLSAPGLSASSSSQFSLVDPQNQASRARGRNPAGSSSLVENGSTQGVRGSEGVESRGEVVNSPVAGQSGAIGKEDGRSTSGAEAGGAVAAGRKGAVVGKLAELQRGTEESDVASQDRGDDAKSESDAGAGGQLSRSAPVQGGRVAGEKGGGSSKEGAGSESTTGGPGTGSAAPGYGRRDPTTDPTGAGEGKAESASDREGATVRGQGRDRADTQAQARDVRSGVGTESALSEKEDGKDVTLERLKAAGINVDFLFSDGGVKDGALEGGVNDANPKPGVSNEGVRFEGLGDALFAAVQSAKGLRVDPDAFFTPLRESLSSAGIEQAWHEASETVQHSAELQGLQGLSDTVSTNWNQQETPVKLGVGAALLLGIVAATLRGAWNVLRSGAVGSEASESAPLEAAGSEVAPGERQYARRSIRRTRGESLPADSEQVKDDVRLSEKAGGERLNGNGRTARRLWGHDDVSRNGDNVSRVGADVSRAGSVVSRTATASGKAPLWVRSGEVAPGDNRLREGAENQVRGGFEDRVRSKGGRRAALINGREVSARREEGKLAGLVLEDRNGSVISRNGSGETTSRDRDGSGGSQTVTGEEEIPAVGSDESGGKTERNAVFENEVMSSRVGKGENLIRGSFEVGDWRDMKNRGRAGLGAGASGRGVTPQVGDGASVTGLLARRKPKVESSGLGLVTRGDRESRGLERSRLMRAEEREVRKERERVSAGGVQNGRGLQTDSVGEGSGNRKRVRVPGQEEVRGMAGKADELGWEKKTERSWREKEPRLVVEAGDTHTEPEVSGRVRISEGLGLEGHVSSSGLANPAGGLRAGPRAHGEYEGGSEAEMQNGLGYGLGAESRGLRRERLGKHDGPSRGLHFLVREGATQGLKKEPRGSPSLAAASQGRRYSQNVVWRREGLEREKVGSSPNGSEKSLRRKGSTNGPETHRGKRTPENGFEKPRGLGVLESSNLTAAPESEPPAVVALPRVHTVPKVRGFQAIDWATFPLGSAVSGRQYSRPSVGSAGGASQEGTFGEPGVSASGHGEPFRPVRRPDRSGLSAGGDVTSAERSGSLGEATSHKLPEGVPRADGQPGESVRTRVEASDIRERAGAPGTLEGRGHVAEGSIHLRHEFGQDLGGTWTLVVGKTADVSLRTGSSGLGSGSGQVKNGNGLGAGARKGVAGNVDRAVDLGGHLSSEGQDGMLRWQSGGDWQEAFRQSRRDVWADVAVNGTENGRVRIG